MESIFDLDFYPTPNDIIVRMCNGLELYDKYVLEPSAGKGDIAFYLVKQGANVLTCEKQDMFISLLSQSTRFMHKDFFNCTREELSHINLIVANPPFSNGEKHLLKMWELAPEGCEIRCLLNSETINNTRYSERKELKELIALYGAVEDLCSCFSESERRTNVNVSLVYLFKPRTGDNEFDGYFDNFSESQEIEEEENSIITYSLVRDVVNRVKDAIKEYDNVIASSAKINALTGMFGGQNIGFITQNEQNGILTRQQYKNSIQKKAWTFIFDKFQMNKYLTKGAMEDVNRFVELKSKFPFTMYNVQQMMLNIMGTVGDRMNKVILQAFDHITKYHDENRFSVEGWKTNDCWLVNKKFILPYMVEPKWSDNTKMSYKITDRTNLDDINKALCYVTGKEFEQIPYYNNIFNYYMLKVDGMFYIEKLGIYKQIYSDQSKETITQKANELIAKGHKVEIIEPKNRFGEWFEWGFFRCKGFKKGSMHFEFIDQDVCDKFNQLACKAKGWSLPETTVHEFRKNAKKSK